MVKQESLKSDYAYIFTSLAGKIEDHDDLYAVCVFIVDQQKYSE